MRAVLVVALLGITLAGCANSLSSLSLPSGKTVPDWAMNSQASADAVSDPAVASPRRSRATAARGAAAPPPATMRRVPQESVPTNSAAVSSKTYGPEWRAQEDAAEERLRRKMNICNGC